MAKHLSKWFGDGVHHVTRHCHDDALYFEHKGRFNGMARYIPHVNRYVRNGKEHKSLAALLRAVVAEQQESRT